MLEKKLQNFCTKRIREAGGLCYKFASPSHRGVPDLIVIYKGKVVFLELKADRGRLSALQMKTADKMRAAGAKVYIAWGLDHAKEVLDEILT